MELKLFFYHINLIANRWFLLKISSTFFCSQLYFLLLQKYLKRHFSWILPLSWELFFWRQLWKWPLFPLCYRRSIWKSRAPSYVRTSSWWHSGRESVFATFFSFKSSSSSARPGKPTWDMTHTSISNPSRYVHGAVLGPTHSRNFPLSQCFSQGFTALIYSFKISDWHIFYNWTSLSCFCVA